MKRIYIQSITKENTNFLKGIAIILIVLHNFYKWINPITGQNEFEFSFDFIMKAYIFIRANPFEFIHVFFNFLGHYGVQAFIFISAYGLTKSYQMRKPHFGAYIFHRFNKLYPSFIFAALLFLVVKIIQDGSFLISSDIIKDLGIQLSLLANFIPGKAFTPNGPWWFYSLIFQFYLVFPILLWLDKKAGNAALLVLSLIGLIFSVLIYKYLDAHSLNSMQFFTGHLPEFCLGIFLAKYDKIKIPAWLAIVAVLFFLGGNIIKWLWPLTFVSFTLLFIIIIQYFTRRRQNWPFKTFAFIGSVSIYIFACHGFLRLNFIILANQIDSTLAALPIGLLYFTFVTGVAYLMLQIEKSVRQWVSTGKTPVIHFVLSILLLILAVFSIPFIKNISRFVQKNQNPQELYSFQDSFDEKNETKALRYCDTVHYSKPFSFFMPPVESYSQSIEINLDTLSLLHLDTIEASVMVFTSDSSASGVLVIELFDEPTKHRLLWNGLGFSSSTEDFKLNKWFKFHFTYKMQNGYCRSNYTIKYYIWNNSQCSLFIDDQELKLIGRR